MLIGILAESHFSSAGIPMSSIRCTSIDRSVIALGGAVLVLVPGLRVGLLLLDGAILKRLLRLDALVLVGLAAGRVLAGRWTALVGVALASRKFNMFSEI